MATGTGASAARRTLHRLARPARALPLPVLRGNGRGLYVRAGDSVIRVMGRGEPQVERVLLERLRRGDVVHDIGANIGWYSLLAARAVGAEGHVVAFEPSLDNAFCAERNARVNGLDNVTVVAAAVTDRGGWLPFLSTGSLQGRLDKDDFAAQAQRRAAHAPRGRRRMLVPATTLDAWLAESGEPPPALVKIDVEGAEVGVLRGMRELLRASRPTLIVELHGTREQVLDELDDAGYEHRPVEVDVPSREAPWWAHLLATPRG